MTDMRRRLGIGLLAAFCCFQPAAGQIPPALRGGYPRAFFFRAAEGLAANQGIPYDRWEATFSRLMGIEGKVLDEEVPGRSARNVEFFTRFKKAHGDQLVLLHYNGNARDPRYRRGEFFAGHWVYYNGAKVLDDVPASGGVTEVRVEGPQLFRVNTGRYRTDNDDVGLCELDANGRPDWHRSEQTQLVSVDARRGVIRLRRGCYGRDPRAFRAGKAYAAAHVTEGPWGRKSHLMWYYNYSTRCPRDAGGRTCGQVHAAEIARRFAPGGELAAFDGVEFDVLLHERGRANPSRGMDCDADGRADNGWFDGVNTYGVGVLEFARALRKLLPDKLLLGDGHGPRHQRAFGVFNGIESEGWPALRDVEVRDFSGGLNRHLFWARNGRAPVFNYVNHKFNEPTGRPGAVRRPQTPWSTHRLVFAAAVFTDSAICYSFAPPKEPGELFGVWDELRMGTAKRAGWLGKPLAPAVRLAQARGDLLAAKGLTSRVNAVFGWQGGNVRLQWTKGALVATATDASQKELRFRLTTVGCNGPDLFVSVAMRGEPMRGYPPQMARLAYVGIPAPDVLCVRPDLPETAVRLRGKRLMPLDRATGASVSFIRQKRLGLEAHDAYLVHPPYKGTTGCTVWWREAAVPTGGRLAFFLGMGEKAPTRSDGVTFRVEVQPLAGGEPGQAEKIFEHTQKAAEWTAHRVSLARWAGRRIRLRFISDCGPQDNATTDHSFWGNVCVLGPEGRSGLTPATRHMTWLGREDFTSGFYFPDVRSKFVDIEFVIEGAEPVTLSRLTAHAHPDVIYREFENGLVLANPSPRPFDFDLASLFPGKRFRRIQASSQQDTATNDGSPVGRKVRLGPKDALFLARRGE